MNFNLPIKVLLGPYQTWACKRRINGKKDSNSSVDEIKPSELLTKVGIVGVANVDTKGNSRFLDSWDEANAISSRELNPRLSKNEV